MAGVASGDDGAKNCSNFKEWSSEEVYAWCREVASLPEDVAAAFQENKIVGKHLPHFIDKSGNLQLQMVERCGLRELCHQLDFKIALESLLESGKQSARASVLQEVKPTGKGKLKLPDIKALDSSSKSIYLTVRARIRKAAEEEFPGNKIPTFRSNPDAKKRLEELVKRLTETCTIRELGFEEEGIRAHIMAVLNERRRMVPLGHSYEGKKRDPSDSENEPPCSQQKKKKSLTNDRDEDEDTDGTEILSSTSQSSPSAPEDEVSVWTSNSQLSQGRLGGRNGSSSCTIIAVLLARSFSGSSQLPFPQRSLPNAWYHAVANAIVEGNHLYDTNFCRPGLLLDVIDVANILNRNDCEETISTSEPLPVWLSAFTEPFSCTLQFHLDKFSRKTGKNAAVFVSSLKSLLIVSEGTGKLLVVDTHSHPEIRSGTTFVCGYACQVASYLAKRNRDAYGTVTEVKFTFIIN